MAEVWPRVSRLGEETWLVEFEPRLDEAINARVRQLARDLAAERVTGVRDVVPAMTSLAVHVDGDAIDEAGLDSVLRLLMAKPATVSDNGVLHEIPVCYEAPFGPDLADVAARCGCSPHDVVAWHAAIEYRVFMIGFLPGFPYLGLLDRRLVLPRRASPRPRVTAGSVGIAGQHTGVYPSDSPGGWHIVGRTPLSLFDPEEDPVVRLSAGDRVRFTPVSAEAYASLAGPLKGATT